MRLRFIKFCLALLTISSRAAEPALKEVFRDDFLIGTALNDWQVRGEISPHGGSRAEAEIIRRHFNSITPENALKWGVVHRETDRYDFREADRFVSFGEAHGMAVIGHTLVWHSQMPGWVFRESDGKPVAKEKLLQRMREHIHAIVGRYKGRVRGWDVVNEALNDDGTLRKSPWLDILGEDYIAKAFQFAHEADPDVGLYYNDYSLELDAKRNAAVEMLRKLLAAGVTVTGVGLQGHYGLTRPSASKIEETIEAFAALGLKVMITELDVNVLPTPGDGGADVSQQFAADPKMDPYTAGLPEEMQQRLAHRYSDLFTLFLKHRRTLERVTFWGVSDASSWLNHFPIRGRTSHPLLFDRQGTPKPCFDAVIKARNEAEQVKR
ncbi:MAG: endo-1,4-beta-xylanase [Verrucomicrobiaceae bacterium]|nr:endo-1,4-beta-xylanase [Verrucomicrobiaceae bacterium]